MNASVEQQLLTLAKGLPASDRIALYVEQFWTHHRGPMTDQEAEERRAYLAGQCFPHWYHGGLVGREVGDELLPSHITGKDPFGFENRLFQRRDYVWVTPFVFQAESYARHVPGRKGSIYKVQPSDDLTISRSTWRLVKMLQSDPVTAAELTEPFNGHYEFCCSRAEVLEVVL